MLNRVTLIGNLGADVELKYMPNGNAVATISVATTMNWKDKTSGEKKTETEWHRVTMFGKLAEIAGQYLKKGSKVYLEGRIKTTKYQKDGADQYSTGIIADVMKMLDSKPEGSQSNIRAGEAPQQNQQPRPTPYNQPAQNQSNPPDNFDDPFDDDIPF